MKALIRLTGYEFQKLIRQPVTIVMLLILVAWTCWNTFGFESQRNMFIEAIDPELTEDTYLLLNELRPEVEEKSALGVEAPEIEVPTLGRSFSCNDIYDVIAQMDRLLAEEKNRQAIISRAKENISFLEGDPNSSFYLQYNEKVLSVMQGRKAPVLYSSINQTDMSLRFFGGLGDLCLSDALFMLFVLLCTCAVFSRDYESRSVLIVYPARYGHSTIFFAKVLSALLFCLGTLIFCAVLTNLLNGIWFGFAPLNVPIQSHPSFTNAPVNWDFWTLWGAILLLKLLGAMFWFLLASVFGLICKNRFPALMIPLVCYGGLFLAVNRLPEETQTIDYFSYWMDKWGYLFNPANLSSHPAKYFTSLRYVDIGGMAVSETLVAVVFTITLSLLFLWAAWALYNRNNVTTHPVSRLRQMLKKRDAV